MLHSVRHGRHRSISLTRAARHALRRQYSSTRPPPPIAFAFDIDGVLLRSSTPIPGAAESLSLLQQKKIPFILLTNGGGKTEEQRVQDINRKLSLPQPLETSQIVQSHTPLRDFASIKTQEKYKHKTVLVCGGDGDRSRLAAESYGFTNVLTPADIYTAYPEIMPFSRNFADYHASFARPLPRPINPSDPTNSLKIDVTFIFNDPRDWALDVQLVLDILLSHAGILGTYSPLNGRRDLPNRGYQQDSQPPLYFSNPDLLWASAYPLSRLGQGGFHAALQGVWHALTHGATLHSTVIGKPHASTYEFAEDILLEHRQTIWGLSRMAARQGLQRVYMIGDNPESDIKGANEYRSAAGVEWRSILVKTGVYKAREGEEPSQTPKMIVEDVREAVEWALRDGGVDS